MPRGPAGRAAGCLPEREIPGMNADEIISAVYEPAERHLQALAPWPGKDALLRAYHAANGEWCINEILEHIALANRYLLLLIEKGMKKALKKADPARIAGALKEYRLMGDRLEQIGVNNSFEWKCPGHMKPTGSMTADDAWMELDAQRGTLMDVLAELKNGEGALQKTGNVGEQPGKARRVPVHLLSPDALPQAYRADGRDRESIQRRQTG